MSHTHQSKFLLPALIVGVALASGCRSDRNAGGDGTTSAAGPASRASGATVNEAMRTGRLQSLPPVVQQAALADLGDATVTGTRAQSSAAGVLYRVSYIENGTPKQAIYDGEGHRVTPAGGAATRPGVDAQPGPGLDLRDPDTGEPLPGAATPATTGPIRQRNTGGY